MIVPLMMRFFSKLLIASTDEAAALIEACATCARLATGHFTAGKKVRRMELQQVQIFFRESRTGARIETGGQKSSGNGVYLYPLLLG